MFKLRSINKVRSQTPCAPPVTYIQGDTAIHGLDRLMVNLSIVLVQDLMVDSLIGNIRDSRTRKVYAKITN